ncbi:MAG TPA: peptidylprolyl isomerase [Steroidobacteraceae bacterium]|nr:peptidylprolyl isomerase [Steroidobacteraceae bacterium]
MLVSTAALLVVMTRARAQESAVPDPGAQSPGVTSTAALAETHKSAQPAPRAPLVHMPPTEARVLAESKPSDWRPLDPQNTLYVQLPAGRVVIELAPRFAPQYVANIKKLVREHYFDGLAIERVQDNFVVQWGDPDHSRSLGTAEKTLPAEFIASSKDVPFTPLPDPDTYAPEVGFAGEFPAARDSKIGREWLVHCYGMVGVGRDDDVESGNGSEIYAVIGQAPRQLDRNVALVGRVVEGMELLSSLPRGSGQLGFYTPREHRVPIESIHLAADVPAEQRSHLEVLRTDTHTFAQLIEARRNRRDSWYKVPAGRIDVCNVPIPARSR